MNGSMFSRLMKRMFAGEYAAMQREYDIDITAFPMEKLPPALPAARASGARGAPLVPCTAPVERAQSQRTSTAH